MEPYLIGINGSPHKQGNTACILQKVLDTAQHAGAKTKIVHLYDCKVIREPGYYSEDPAKAISKNMPNDDLTALFSEIRRADGLVFATPTYWANMSAAMKDFIERLTALENEDYALEGKVASFIATSKENEGGVEMAAMSMVMAVAQMGVLIPPNAIIWSPGDWKSAHETSVDWAWDHAKYVGKNMVDLITLFNKEQIIWSE